MTLTTPGRQALMEATMDRYQQCERGRETSCLLDYLCIKESIMVGFTQCENWNRFSTLSSSQAPHSTNQIKTLETVKPPPKKPSHNETSRVMKENHEGRSSLVQWEREALTGCSLCRETLRSCSFQICQIRTGSFVFHLLVIMLLPFCCRAAPQVFVFSGLAELTFLIGYCV